MSSTLAITSQRRHRRQRDLRSARQRLQRAVLVFGFSVSALLVISILVVVFTYAGLTKSLPPLEQLPILLDSGSGLLLQPTRLYDRSGDHLLAVLSPTDSPRKYIPFDQLPPSLVNAAIAVAQPNFWTSPGYQLSGWRDPLQHPTLAQELAYELLLWDVPPGPVRAVHERMLAAQMTARYGRQRIIEWYLNTVDYGHYAYGVEAASQLYLGKSVTKINLAEAALLVAIGQAPALNPLDAPQAVEEGRIKVLQAMMEQRMITPSEVAQAVLNQPSLTSATPKPGLGNEDGLAPAFIKSTLSQLDVYFGAHRVERGGLTLITSLDYDLQLQAECVLRTQLARLGGSRQTVLTREDTPCEAARLLPSLTADETLPDAVASVIILDPQTGQILAEVGDMSQGIQAELLASHPAGTAVTPFIYLTGFSRGVSPATLAWDIPGEAPALGQVYHGPVRLRTALANDYLPPAVNLLEQMSQQSVENIAASFRLEIPAGTRLLQDDFNLSPLDLAAAYGIFANSGILAGQPVASQNLNPVSVLQVIGADHSIWVDWTDSQSRSVVGPQLAYLMNQSLSDETARWPSLGHPNPLEIGRPAGAKLSPALDRSGAWTVGYTPQLVTVVWLGSARASAQSSDESNSAPVLSAETWHALMQSAVSDMPSLGWEMPAGIVTVPVCDPSGLLPTAACPNVVNEVFLEGRQPVQGDDLYQPVQVNIETGLLATVFTRPELVETRNYMVVPPQARAWAAAAGIPTPPTAYDTIQKQPLLPDVNISAPEMFADGRGVIEIRGSARGADFLSYRLEYGAGLYPRDWVQIGTDNAVPVNQGILGSWDTRGLNGLYALRLMLVHQDQRVDQALVQVTLDNTPPQLAVSYPLEGQEILLAQENHVALQAQASDPFLSRVDFYIDGALVGSSSTSPYGLLWNATKGKHTLRVVALDRAGNSTESSVHFSVK